MKKMICLVCAAATVLSTVNVVGAERYGYEYVLPAEFINIERVANGYIAYSDVNEGAFYDLNGEKVSENYDFFDVSYDEEHMLTYRDGKNIILDAYGNKLGEYENKVLDLSEYVLVNLSDVNNDGRPPFYYEGEFGVYTYEGEQLRTFSYDDFRQNKQSGISLTFAGGRLLYKSDGKWGAIDENFNPVIELMYDKIYPFYNKSGGVTVAVLDGKEGLINRNGGIVLDFVYDWIEVSRSEGGRIVYKLHKDGMCALADEYGNETVKASELIPGRYYDDVGLLSVYTETEIDGETVRRYGVTDCDGNIIIPAEFDTVYCVSDGVISVKGTDGKTHYYDFDGNATDCDGYTYWNGVAYIGEGKLVDESGNVVISDLDWTSVKNVRWNNPYGDGTFEVGVGEKYGVARYIGFVSEWARETVEKAKTAGILDSSVGYDYTSSITREQFCDIAVAMAEKSGVKFATENPQRPSDLADTDSVSVMKLYKSGIVFGKDEGNSGILFAPNDYLTREEAATILARLINEFYPNWAAHELYYIFDDESDISEWAMEAVQRLCNMGIMNGVGGGLYLPQGRFTVEQAIAAVMRVYDAYADETDVIGSGDAVTDIAVSDEVR